MTTETRYIEVHGLPVEVVRKEIKNLHLGVYPPSGRVRVAVPSRVSDETVRLAVITRLGWIRRRQAAFRDQDRQSERQMVTGESHFVEGFRYRLNVIEQDGVSGIRVRSNHVLELRVRHASTPEQRRAMLDRWYRGRLRKQVSELMDRWQPVVGVDVTEWGIRRMKTRWGTCQVAARRIWLNLELAKKPPRCTEYIVVHELVHLLERHHNEVFLEHMKRLLPQCGALRDELNQAPLAHEDWGY